MCSYLGAARVITAVVLLSLSIVGRQADPADSAAQRLYVDGIVNFAEVSPTVYRGGQPDAEQLGALQKMGINIIVDMRSGNRSDERDAVTKLGIEYVQIPWHCPFPHDRPFAKFLQVVGDNPGKKIFVHCRLGDDRSGMAIAAYRMAEEGWSADQAMKEMRTFGFPGLHRIICQPPAAYEHSFPERLKKDAACETWREGKKREWILPTVNFTSARIYRLQPSLSSSRRSRAWFCVSRR
jgi:protein tyrosine phosphatase (PTP) superfamily phosphohydrolase (DUF442 family)